MFTPRCRRTSGAVSLALLIALTSPASMARTGGGADQVNPYTTRPSERLSTKDIEKSITSLLESTQQKLDRFSDIRNNPMLVESTCKILNQNLAMAKNLTETKLAPYVPASNAPSSPSDKARAVSLESLQAKIQTVTEAGNGKCWGTLPAPVDASARLTLNKEAQDSTDMSRIKAFLREAAGQRGLERKDGPLSVRCSAAQQGIDRAKNHLQSRNEYLARAGELEKATALIQMVYDKGDGICWGNVAGQSPAPQNPEYLHTDTRERVWGATSSITTPDVIPVQIEWSNASIENSGWTDEEIATAKEATLRDAYDKFMAFREDKAKRLTLQDMVNSYTYNRAENPSGYAGSVSKSYAINSYEDFKNAFVDSGESFTRYISRAGKYWYGERDPLLNKPVEQQ